MQAQSRFGWFRPVPGAPPPGRALVYFSLIAVCAVWIGFKAFDARTAGRLVTDWGYPVILATFAAWVAFVTADLARGAGPGAAPAPTRREVSTVGIWILVLWVVALLTTDWGYKILYDELVIQSTAWNMHMEREVGALGRAYEIDGMLRSLQSYLDKRPYFFPFLVSLIHDLTGYREANAILLNAALFPVVLGLLYLLGRRCGGHAAGLVSAVSSGAFSLLALNATGAGLEMLNLALILALALTGARWLERPDESRLSVLVLTAVLLAHTRYESAVFVPVAGLLVMVGWIRSRAVILPPVALIAPALMIPCALHNTYLSGSPVLWELRDGYEARFSLDFLPLNAGQAADYFFNRSPQIANSLWLTFAGGSAGLVACLLAANKVRRRRAFSPSEISVTLVFAGIASNLALLMVYYWGDLSDPVVSRLALPLHMMLALAVGAVVVRAPARHRRRAVQAALACALLCYHAWGLPVNPRLNYLNTSESLQRWEQRVIATRGPGKRLIVTDKSPLFWFTLGVSSTSIARASSRGESLAFHLAHHSFSEILVTQALRAITEEGDFQIETANRLPPGFVLEPIAERRIGARLQRLSVLREIKMDATSAPGVPSDTAP